MRTSFALVFNNSAGVARPRRLSAVLDLLARRGARVAHVDANSAAEATAKVADIARAGMFDAVIAAGGDGTFRAVAAGAAGSAMAVGFLPLGTGNIVSYEIGSGKRAADLAQSFIADPDIAIRGGLVNGAPFFLMVGAGFDGAIVNGLNFRLKRLAARAAYVQPVLSALAHGPRPFDVTVDGERHTATWAIVTRASHYGGSFVLTRATQLGADPMVAILMDAPSRRRLLAAASALPLGRLGDPARAPRGVVVRVAERVVIGRTAAAPIQIDGDQTAGTPAEIVAHGPVVRVIVPSAYAAALTNRHTNRLQSES